NADDILDALSDDYMEGGNLQQALRRLMQEGIRNEDGKRTMGLRDLLERMRNQRNQQLNRYNMASGVMDDLREKLEEIKQLERQGIQRRLDDTPADNQQPGQQPANKQQTPGEQPDNQHQDKQTERQPGSDPGSNQQDQ